MKFYRGRRATGGGLEVTVCDGEGVRRLDPRNDLMNHSPTGLECGYAGSGPAQLAFAILADHLDDDGQADALSQRFKTDVISQLPRDRAWSIDDAHIERWLESA